MTSKEKRDLKDFLGLLFGIGVIIFLVYGICREFLYKKRTEAEYFELQSIVEDDYMLLHGKTEKKDE